MTRVCTFCRAHQITDSCQCAYSPNSYSNKRWCCGDMQHFDLSVWTFQKVRAHVRLPSLIVLERNL